MNDDIFKQMAKEVDKLIEEKELTSMIKKERDRECIEEYETEREE